MIRTFILGKAFLYLVIFGMIVFASSALADNVQIEGSSYSFDEKSGIAEYQNPRMKYGDWQITAESLVYKQKEKQIFMSGGIYAWDKDILLTADKMSFDLESRQAELLKATLYQESKNVYIKAEKMLRVSEKEFQLFDVVMTQCRPQEKSWEITSSEMVYRPNDFAWATHVAFYLHSVPIIYSPAFAWSTTRERSTGLLQPSFTNKHSSNIANYTGNRLKIPYFFALGQDHDLTVTADLIARRGVGVNFEYNYAFEQGMLGRLNHWSIDESVAFRQQIDENGMEDGDDPNPKRYSWYWDHRQNLLGGQLFLKRMENSDNEVRKEYESLNVELDVNNTREMSWLYPWQNGSISIVAQDNDTFVSQSRYSTGNDSTTHLNSQPSISLSQSWGSAFGLPVQTFVSANRSWFHRQYGWLGTRDTSSLKLSSSTNIGFINIIPEAERRWLSYNVKYSATDEQVNDSDFISNPDSFGWKQDEFGLELNFELFKLFYSEVEPGKADGKLAITPRLKYKYIEDVDQRRSLTLTPGNNSLQNSLLDYSTWGVMFDGQDQVRARNSRTFQLDTVYYTKDISTNAVAKRFEMNLIQHWDLNRKNTAAETEDSFIGPQPAESWRETEYGEQRLPLRVKLGFWPDSRFSAKLFYRLDNIKRDVLENTIEFSTQTANGSQLKISYNNNRQAYEDLDGSVFPVSRSYSLAETIVFSDQWKAGITGTWDFTRNSLPENDGTTERLNRPMTAMSANVFFNQGCYKLAAGYQEEISTGTFNNQSKEYLDKVFSLTFELNDWGVTYDTSLNNEKKVD